jgi:hypothetical protein
MRSMAAQRDAMVVRRANPEPGRVLNRVILLRVGEYSVATFGLLASLGVTAGAWAACTRQIQAGMAPARYAAALFLLLDRKSVV